MDMLSKLAAVTEKTGVSAVCPPTTTIWRVGGGGEPQRAVWVQHDRYQDIVTVKIDRDVVYKRATHRVFVGEAACRYAWSAGASVEAWRVTRF
eukprot:SAG11_NODE_17727_length_510_cov_1.255474_1_plen_92_part_01